MRRYTDIGCTIDVSVSQNHVLILPQKYQSTWELFTYDRCINVVEKYLQHTELVGAIDAM